MNNANTWRVMYEFSDDLHFAIQLFQSLIEI